MKIAVIYGTRPESIKLAPVIHALRDFGVTVTVINTGQHQALMPEVMSLFNVCDDYQLEILRPRQSLGALMAHMISRVSRVLTHVRPDHIVVQGDTMTAVASALAAFYLGIPVSHVEAGLRTQQLDSPFPEEANRRVIASIAAMNFAPSVRAVRNLRDEHVLGEIFLTGNPVVDALYAIADRADGTRASTGKRVVATIHRRENFPYLEGIFKAFVRIAEEGVEVLLPVHANPIVADAAHAWLARSAVRLIEPVDYLPWIGLLKTADLVITDSGGLQEEAPVLGIPILIARQTTERPEVVDGGYGYLVGVDEEHIFNMALRALNGELPFRQGSPYGDGRTSLQIASILTGYSTSVLATESGAVGG